MDDAIYRIVSEFEAHHSLPPNSQTCISESALLDLQTLLDNAINTDDHLDIERLYDELSSKNVSVSSLVPPFMASMDSGPINLSLMAANVYLSLILSPNAPVFTLFTPMAFLSLLRSIRRFLKNPNLGNASSASSSSQTRNKRGGGRRGPSRNRSQNVEDDSDRNEESQIDIRILFSALERLELVLRLVHLDRFPDSMKSLIQTVAEIPLTATEVSGASGNYNKLCQFCTKILIELLKPEHGDQLVSAAEVLKSMSNSILLVKSPARTYALGFVVNQMMALAKDSNEIRKAVVNTPKYLVQKVPEKADARSLAVESILEITKSMEFDDQVRFIDYVVVLTQSKTRFRLLAVDLIPALTTSLRDPLGLNSETTDEKSWGLRCIEALIERCVDSAATIRARALSNLGQLIGFLAKDDRSKALLKDAMGCNEHENRMNSLLRRMCADEKAAVRKAALTLISKLTSSLGGSLDETMVKTMGMACSDSLVSIRKAAISALSETFRRFSYGFVTREWLHSVPRLITDNETSIQEECENLFLELVLDRISESHDNRLPNKRSVSFDPNIESEDGVLSILREVCDGEVMPWVRKICTNLGKKKRLKFKVVIALQDIVKASESAWLSQSRSIKKWTAPPGAWFLLSELSLFLPKAVEWEFLRHHWELFDKHGLGGEVNNDPPPEPMAHNENIGGIESNTVAWAGDRVFLLQTISNVSVELPPEPAADLAHSFLRRIEEFNMHPTEINAHVKALRTVCKQKALNVDEAESLVMKWVSQLLTKASHILDKFLSNESEKNKKNNFFTPTKTGGKKGKRAEAAESKSITAVYTIGSLVIICPTADLQSIVPLLHKVITSGNSNSKVAKLPGLNLSVKKTAPSLYIQAWLTMGKICLADGQLAKRYIPLFMQELEKSDLAALRNNIVVMMADFCVRYTALVDCYMSKITKCLRDPCELVRRQTFVLLSRLLQRDYVKWRGVLFLGFLLSLVDESEKIRQLADYLFNNILKAKAPLLAYNGFVEAIFVLNDCNAHTGQCNSKSSNAETRIFAIKGNDENSRSKRMHIYVSLLKQMAPEHLLATFAKVCAEVLVSASDGKLNLEDSTGQSVLQDCFQILACKEIKIIPSRGAASDLGDIEEEVGGDNGAVAAAAARGKAITQAVKKGLIQNAIPIFIELKKLLESKNSPLIGSLMECLRIILKDYKNEIDEILIADKQLQKELIYDMQKYETMKEKSSKDVGGSSGFQSPPPPPGESNLRRNDSTVVASAMEDAAAAAVAESVLKDVNRGKATPPLSAMNMPKLKSATRGGKAAAAEVYSGSGRGSAVLESLRKRHSFDSDEEN